MDKQGIFFFLSMFFIFQNTLTANNIWKSLNLALLTFFYVLTWDNITKPYGGHGDEAEVEGIKESEVLINTDEVGTKAKEDDEEEQSSTSGLDVVSEPNFLLLIPIKKRILQLSVFFKKLNSLSAKNS